MNQEQLTFPQRMKSRTLWLHLAALGLTFYIALEAQESLVQWTIALGVILGSWQGRKVMEKRGPN